MATTNHSLQRISASKASMDEFSNERAIRRNDAADLSFPSYLQPLPFQTNAISSLPDTTGTSTLRASSLGNPMGNSVSRFVRGSNEGANSMGQSVNYGASTYNELGSFDNSFQVDRTSWQPGSSLKSQVGNSSTGHGFSMGSEQLNPTRASASAACVAELPQRKQSKRLSKKCFRRLVQVLMKHLEKKDPALRRQVYLTIRSCQSRGDQDLQERVRELVGEQHWRIAEEYLAQIFTNLVAKHNAEKKSNTPSSQAIKRQQEQHQQQPGMNRASV